VADIVSVSVVVVDGDFGCDGVDGDEYDYFAGIGGVAAAAVVVVVVAFCKTLQVEDLIS
jgi:hypothetical protein